MSVVQGRVNALKSQLNTLATAQIQALPQDAPPPSSSIYLTELNTSLTILSAPTHTAPSLDQISRLLIEVNQAKLQEREDITQSDYVKELEWLFLARCTVDVYGCLLEQLFQQTLPLAQDIWYWDDVLSQPTWRLLYLIQSPLPPQPARLTISLPLPPPPIRQSSLAKHPCPSPRHTHSLLNGNPPSKSPRQKPFPKNCVPDTSTGYTCCDRFFHGVTLST
jgi:hypothetical protein